MAALKYWDNASGSWVTVAGTVAVQPFLPRDGGTMRGPLTVGGDLTVAGGVRANYFAGSGAGAALDADIALRGRTVEAGGSIVSSVADPIAEDDAANLRYLQAAASVGPQRIPLAVGDGWQNYPGTGNHGLLSAVQKRDGMVSLHGVIQTTRTATYPYPVITTLPEAMRPTQHRMFLCAGAHLSVLHRVDIRNGQVILEAGPSTMGTGHWLSLSNICYYPS